MIDVREPHEFAFDVNWSDLGLKQTPRNVPLSRFVSFMNELLIEKNFDRELIFLCRSGTRSLHVTKTLRRLGFNRVWNLDGGLALGLK